MTGGNFGAVDDNDDTPVRGGCHSLELTPDHAMESIVLSQDTTDLDPSLMNTVDLWTLLDLSILQCFATVSMSNSAKTPHLHSWVS